MLLDSGTQSYHVATLQAVELARSDDSVVTYTTGAYSSCFRNESVSPHAQPGGATCAARYDVHHGYEPRASKLCSTHQLCMCRFATHAMAAQAHQASVWCNNVCLS